VIHLIRISLIVLFGCCNFACAESAQEKWDKRCDMDAKGIDTLRSSVLRDNYEIILADYWNMDKKRSYLLDSCNNVCIFRYKGKCVIESEKTKFKISEDAIFATIVGEYVFLIVQRDNVECGVGYVYAACVYGKDKLKQEIQFECYNGDGLLPSRIYSYSGERTGVVIYNDDYTKFTELCINADGGIVAGKAYSEY